MTINASIAVLTASISSVLSNKYVLLKALAIPLVLYVLAMLVLEASNASLGLQVFVAIISMILYVYIAVATHRVQILGGNGKKGKGIYEFSAREFQFLFAIFEVVFYCLPVMLFLFIPKIGEHVTTVAVAYIGSRLSLIFPSIAIDAPMTARASWQATRDYQILMFLVVFVFSLLFTGIEFILSKAFDSNTVMSVFSSLTVVLVVGVLSEAYKVIMNEL